jgi:hypothetical protein
MALTIANLEYVSLNNKRLRTGKITFDSSYPTGGESLLPSDLGLDVIESIQFSGVTNATPISMLADYDYTNKKIRLFSPTPTGSVSAPTFTGTAPTADLNLATPAFSGTGLTAAGQVITTTSTHTMTLNQCAGMWLISATGATPPNLILSNTAVTGAAAVLTVQGSANTDAGAYKIVSSYTPAGTISAPTLTGTATLGMVEAANASNLAAYTLRFVAVGY